MTEWFNISSARDMLAKAQRDYDGALTAIDPTVQQDRAMDCAVAIWSVREYLTGSAADHLAAKYGRGWLDVLDGPDRPLKTCFDLANGAKHKELLRGNPIVAQTATSTPASQVAYGPIRIYLTNGDVLKVIYLDGRRVDAMPILAAAIQRWTRIFETEFPP